VLHLKAVLLDQQEGWEEAKTMEERGVQKLKESSKSEEESNTSRREWLKKFSTMKVGPPQHLKPTVKLR